MLVSPLSLFSYASCFPWWRIVLLCYFVSALHPSMRIPIAIVDLSRFIFGYRLISSCFVRVGTMLSYRFRLLLRIV